MNETTDQTSSAEQTEASAEQTTAPTKSFAKKSSKKPAAAPKKTAIVEPIRPYAVILSGGKQYRVAPGKTVIVEKLDGQKGDQVVFDQVLLLANGEAPEDLKLGAPNIDGATVKGKIVASLLDEKVVIFKKHRRKGFTKKQGHRQKLSEVLIESIA